MCGILGIISTKLKSVDYLIEQLYRLEHRGYDSVGIAYKKFSQDLKILKIASDVKNFTNKFYEHFSSSFNVGIVHTRWATHGVVSDINSHPHKVGFVSVVHNGIIENFIEIKEWLEERDCAIEFLTDTDTEVISALIHFFYIQIGSADIAVKESVKMFKGNYSFIVLFEDTNMLIAVKNGNSLLFARSDEAFILGSDASVFDSNVCPQTISDGEMIICDILGIVKIFDINKNMYVITQDIAEIKKIENEDFQNNICNNRNIKNNTNDNIENNENKFVTRNILHENGYHLISEIKQQPLAIYNTLNIIDTNLIEIIASRISCNNKFSIIACGTSFYVAKIAREWFERFLGISVSIELASEIRFRNFSNHSNINNNGDVYIFVSQSGETTDTILAAKSFKNDSNNVCVAIVNNRNSTLTQIVDYTLYTNAGFEFSVAATKTFVAQLVVLQQLFCVLSMNMQNLQYTKEIHQINDLFHNFGRLNSLFAQCFILSEEFFDRIYKNIIHTNSLLYMGRSLGYGLALEGALKMKELSYIHAEGVASGELKHGTLALIDKDFPIIAINYSNDIFKKNLSNIQEVYVRNAKIFGITDFSGRSAMSRVCTEVLALPDMNEFLVPFFYIIPLQLIAYKISVLKGNNVDRPRNLAKSITVE